MTAPSSSFQTRRKYAMMTVGLASIGLPLACILEGCMRASIPLDPAAAHLTALATSRPADGAPALITGFRPTAGQLSFPLHTPGGLYRPLIRYRTEGDRKAFTLKVNDLPYENLFPASPARTSTLAAGLIELPPGDCTLTLTGGWGHYAIERLDLIPATLEPPPTPPAQLSDPDATPETRALFARLRATYGHATLSGVYSPADDRYIASKTARHVAVMGGDLMDYTPSRVAYGAKDPHSVEHALTAWRSGQIVTLCWHWGAPSGLLDRVDTDDGGHPVDKRWYRGFYTNATTFDLRAALANPNGSDHALLLRDIDGIAAQLRRLADAHVPVLWRPLHEAEGAWFWWGAKGPAPLVQLWRLLHDRLTRVHHLHNLIWVYTADRDPAWYPGDDVVDLVGVDAYPKDNRDPLTANWDAVLHQYGPRKMLTLSEVGGVPDLDRAYRHGVRWLYFNTWTGEHGPAAMTDTALLPRLNSPHVGYGPATRPAR